MEKYDWREHLTRVAAAVLPVVPAHPVSYSQGEPMKTLVAAIALLTITACEPKQEAAPATADTAVARAPAADTAAPMAVDSIMARDTAAAP